MSIRMDKVIMFQKKGLEDTKEDTTDDEGFNQDIWKDYKKVMASINNLYGNEYWKAKAVQGERTVEIKTRYIKELESIDTDTENYRIIYNNRIYDIKYVDNVAHANMWLKIKAMIRE